MREPLTPMLFPLLGAHFSHAASADTDKKMKETCCMMAGFAADPTPNRSLIVTNTTTQRDLRRPTYNRRQIRPAFS